jgi:hypothetical protein
MLSYAPLPPWMTLARALAKGSLSPVELAAPWKGDGAVAGWLSRSAWSLALVAGWRKRGDAEISMWVPDFFCNSALELVRLAGVNLVFYPVTDALEPDLAACRLLVRAGKPDVFVLVHYFGRPTPAASARDFCMQQGAWLVEDAAQCLRPTGGVGEYGDFVLYSPHKHLPVPDGAVLVARAAGASKLGGEGITSLGDPNDWPEQLSQLNDTLPAHRKARQATAIIWLAKRVLQKLGVSRKMAPPPQFAESGESNGTSPPLLPPRPSGLALRLLARLTSTLADVARHRQRTQLVLDALVSADSATSSAAIATAERPKRREWTPYLAAYWAGESHAAEIHDRWQRRGIPVTTWPDLPPEVTADPDQHATAWRLRHERLYLIVHQSLSVNALRAAFVTRR